MACGAAAAFRTKLAGRGSSVLVVRSFVRLQASKQAYILVAEDQASEAQLSFLRQTTTTTAPAAVAAKAASRVLAAARNAKFAPNSR